MDFLSHKGEVIADFQQFYNIALPLHEDIKDAERMSLLWEQLPANSRCARRWDAACEWDSATYLLWRIEHSLRVWMWAQADKKHRNSKSPEPLQTPKDIAKKKQQQKNALAAKKEINAILGIKEE